MKKAMKRTAYGPAYPTLFGSPIPTTKSNITAIAATSSRGELYLRTRASLYLLLAPKSTKRQEVEYAGQQRYIIHRNAPIVDDEGYEVESDDDDERAQDAIAAAAEFDPYNNVRLEQLLAPLTASTDLPTHPTISKPFVSKTLTGLADQSCDIMRKENKSLWRIKHLFTRLVGDHTWAPCELMLGSDDVGLFANDHFAPLRAQQIQEVAVAQNASEPGAAVANDETILSKTLDSHERSAGGDQTGDLTTAGTGEGDVSMVDPDETITENPQDTKDDLEPVPQTDDKPEPDAAVAITNGDGAVPNRAGDPPVVQKPSGENSEHVNGTGTGNGNEPAPTTNGHLDAHADGPPRTSLPHSGLTVKANNGSEAMSVVSELLEEIFIHPLYQSPANAEPDRGGLSVDEANDMRQLVALYVQKQEEVCRGAEKLHEGLLKADRLRKTVLQWSKAEAHCGPNRDMSDGEDWYDKEEWGLTEDLKKGQDEEEEETGTSTKKTRNRR
ncbi:hypothetical protein D7B24_003437 [Verticillium nonalfalfae]|uniref:Transcriptional regulatory protein RXT2 N-terminal domain-containing protein n=1 Tax=Verticillium nonalfalfae TaxID=1051616 RepID=A0A3M9YMN4_9PEZI|nr:uncharacterized protein D7B24_003437 [Verticillium nonalfalfae]RNJ61026.1 hypothetical protein D7B24_003437 [Verticillium nonalfalfae]